MGKLQVTYDRSYDEEPGVTIVECDDIQIKEGVIAFVDEDGNITLLLQAKRLISAIPLKEEAIGKA